MENKIHIFSRERMIVLNETQKQTIFNMLAKMFEEEINLNSEEAKLLNRLSEITERRKEIHQQREVLELVSDKHEIKYAKVSFEPEPVKTEKHEKPQVVEKIRRMNKSIKLEVEHVIKDIINNAGRPVKTGELIDELAKQGYKWNKYVTAAGFFKKCSNIEQPYRGYWQLKR